MQKYTVNPDKLAQINFSQFTGAVMVRTYRDGFLDPTGTSTYFLEEGRDLEDTYSEGWQSRPYGLWSDGGRTDLEYNVLAAIPGTDPAELDFLLMVARKKITKNNILE